jgi:hypothetical protein
VHKQILNLANASDECTRLAALRGLVSLWEASDFEPVFDRYLHDPSEEVRKEAAWTLQQNADSGCWQRLFAAWSTDSLVRHRVWACQLAVRFGRMNLLTELKSLQTDADDGGALGTAATCFPFPAAAGVGFASDRENLAPLTLNPEKSRFAEAQ